MIIEVAVDAERLLQIPGRGRVIPNQPPHNPQVGKDVGLAEPVTEVLSRAQGRGMTG